MIVAIDGPAGSGKTTIARILAEKTGFTYLNTGATYRALTYAALGSEVDLSDAQSLKRLAESLDIRIDKETVYLNGKNIGDKIGLPRIDKNISMLVAYPEVREVMVGLQRKIANGRDCVVEGRDITTVVFPEAEFKFYVDAAVEVRARRRFEELKARGIRVQFAEVKKSLENRDHADKNRKFSPLKISEQAFYIDTTDLSITEAVNAVAAQIGIFPQ